MEAGDLEIIRELAKAGVLGVIVGLQMWYIQFKDKSHHKEREKRDDKYLEEFKQFRTLLDGQNGELVELIKENNGHIQDMTKGLWKVSERRSGNIDGD